MEKQELSHQLAISPFLKVTVHVFGGIGSYIERPATIARKKSEVDPVRYRIDRSATPLDARQWGAMRGPMTDKHIAIRGLTRTRKYHTEAKSGALFN